MCQLPEDDFKRYLAGSGFQFFERCVGQDAAVIHHDDAVTDFLHNIQYMGAVQNRLALRTKRHQQVFNQNAGIDIKAGERVAVRLGADFQIFFDEGENLKTLRLGVGLTF